MASTLDVMRTFLPEATFDKEGTDLVARDKRNGREVGRITSGQMREHRASFGTYLSDWLVGVEEKLRHMSQEELAALP